MANIRFYPYQKKGECKVYLRLKIGTVKDFRLSSGFTIQDASNWSDKTNFPTTSHAENKKLKNRLKELESKIDKYLLEIEQDEKKSIRDTQSKDIKNLIQKFHNLEPLTNKDLLIGYSEYFTKLLYNGTYTKNGVQFKYSQMTINKYDNFTNVLQEYQKHIGRIIKITDIDEDFGNDFMNYLTEIKARSINTKGRYLKRLKTIVKHAESNGIKVNPNYNKLKGFEDETIVTYLTFEEIDQIIEKEMPTKRLEIAKDWFIISLFTAQRISDLHRFTKNNIQTIQGGRYIALKQFKTAKSIEVPIHYKIEIVLKKYNDKFPPKFSENEQSNRSTLSTLIKEVCRLSGLREKVIGRYNGVKGTYPKYQLISNHTGRRSFACNFYNLPNWSIQEIMNITGHESSKNFYKYIDKTDRTLSINARRKFDQMEQEDLAKKSPQLSVVRNIDNK